MLLRGLFWLGLVASLVPYKTVDVLNGTFEVDREALVARVKALPHFCEDNRQACDAAVALATVMRAEGERLVSALAAKAPTSG